MTLRHVYPHLAPAADENSSSAPQPETTTVPGTTEPVPAPAAAEEVPAVAPAEDKPKPPARAGWMPFVQPSTSERVDFSQHYDVSTLKGRSALITGGAHGIGRGCVEGLAEAG
jgi:hypothetical protein